MRGFEHGLGEGLHRVEPVAVEPDVEFARIVAVDLQPVDEFGIGGTA